MYGYTQALRECPSKRPLQLTLHVPLGWSSIGHGVKYTLRHVPSQPSSSYDGLGFALSSQVLQMRPHAIHFLVLALMDNPPLPGKIEGR